MNMKNKMLALAGALALGLSSQAILAQDAGGSPAGDQPAPPPREPGAPHGPHGPGQRPPPAIIGALDANHDGIIDAQEIANASNALLSLDKNGDGQLTPEEFMGVPPRGTNDMGREGMLRRGPGGPGGTPPKEIMDKYDVNKDGKLDESERAALRADVEAGKIPPPPGRRGPGMAGRRPAPSAQELMDKFDTNHDGVLDAQELAAMVADMKAQHPGAGAGRPAEQGPGPESQAPGTPPQQ